MSDSWAGWPHSSAERFILTMHCKGAARTRCGPLGAPRCVGHIASSDPRVAEHETRCTAFTLVPETRITALYEAAAFPPFLARRRSLVEQPQSRPTGFSRNTNHESRPSNDAVARAPPGRSAGRLARQGASAISPLPTLGSRNTKHDVRPLRLFPRHESRLFTSRRLSPSPCPSAFPG